MSEIMPWIIILFFVCILVAMYIRIDNLQDMVVEMKRMVNELLEENKKER